MRVLWQSKQLRARERCAAPYDGQLLASSYVRPEVCRLFPPSGKSQIFSLSYDNKTQAKMFWSSAVVRLVGAGRALGPSAQ